jgi:[acyl-carrier-protein] S-malonyltransferase
VKRAVVFSGQGAQFVGMGKDLADAFPVCRDLYRKADEVLGYSLSGICFGGPIEELTKSNRCQPAIFLASMACLHALSASKGGLTWTGTAGLSLGEWTALHVAGCLNFEDTLRVLAARGQFMQEACEERAGGMVSVIGLAEDRLREVCQKAGVEIANLNSPDQTVLSGAKERIEDAARLANEAGAKKTVVLNVAGAFHSPLMASAAGKLETLLAGIAFRPAAFPVLANVTGQPHGDPAAIRREMVRQVTQSVQWVSCVQWFRQQGTTEYVECGPGRVLTGLIKRMDGAAQLHNVQDKPSLDKVAAALVG